jgi:hypothetical protein
MTLRQLIEPYIPRHLPARDALRLICLLEHVVAAIWHMHGQAIDDELAPRHAGQLKVAHGDDYPLEEPRLYRDGDESDLPF